MVHELVGIAFNRVDLRHVAGVKPEFAEAVLAPHQDPFFRANMCGGWCWAAWAMGCACGCLCALLALHQDPFFRASMCGGWCWAGLCC